MAGKRGTSSGPAAKSAAKRIRVSRKTARYAQARMQFTRKRKMPRAYQQTAKWKPKSAQHPLKRLSAHHNTRYVPIPNSIGEFTFTPTKISDTVQVPANGRMALMFFWSKTQLRGLGWNPDDSLGAVYEFNLTMLENSDPLTVRPNTLSVSLINRSEMDATNGTVRALSVPQGLLPEFDSSFTPPAEHPQRIKWSSEFLMDTMAMLLQSPDTQTFSADFFRTSKTFICAPAKHSGLESFSQYATFASKSDKENKITSDLKFNSMNVLMLLLDASTTQKYEVTVKSNDCARYAANTLYAQMTTKSWPADHKKFAETVAGAQEQGAKPMDTNDA